jgi:hypothetical protein
MNNDIQDKIKELQDSVIGDILTLAEIGLQPEQFRQFKKKVFQVYHEKLRPETNRLLHLQWARSIQTTLSTHHQE